MKEKKKETITHHWDDEMGDATCGYLSDDEIVSGKLDFVNCARCLKIIKKACGVKD